LWIVGVRLGAMFYAIRDHSPVCLPYHMTTWGEIPDALVHCSGALNGQGRPTEVRRPHLLLFSRCY